MSCKNRVFSTPLAAELLLHRPAVAAAEPGGRRAPFAIARSIVPPLPVGRVLRQRHAAWAGAVLLVRVGHAPARVAAYPHRVQAVRLPDRRRPAADEIRPEEALHRLLVRPAFA